MGLDKTMKLSVINCNLGKAMDAIKKVLTLKKLYEKNIGTYGRFADAVKYIDPREE